MLLMKNGLSEYRIVIAADADVAVHHAATELANYLDAISGTLLSITKDTAPAKEKEIVIGQTNREGTPCGCGLKNDGFTVKTVGEKLFIFGLNGRAVHYGVYWFLEDVLGCRFYTHNVEKIPTLPVVEIPELDTTRVSPLEYRETYWREPELYPAFAMKRGFNASLSTHFGDELGGSFNALGLCHTTFSLVDPDVYFDTHPEYFSLVNGRRIRKETQLCLTNPDVLEIAKKSLRQQILDHPECKIFSVSQMDWYNPCECPACKAIDDEEESHMGTMLRFVNACADSIAEEFPDVIIETLAYQYTRKPPKITKARPNVCVCICSIECCFTHPLDSCNEVCVPFKHLSDPDVTFQQDLEGWSDVCKRMMVWDYTTNYRFYLTPMINLHVLQSNIKYFLKNNVTLLFEQGNAQSVSGEFGELRAYLISKLMWEPDGDVSAWMDDFLTGYYGEGAAKPIRAYIDTLADHVVRHDVHAGIYENPMDVIPDLMIPKLDAFWDEAEAAACGADLARVRRSRLQMKFLKQHRRTRAHVDFEEAGEELIREVVDFGIQYVQEGVDREFSFEQIRDGRLPDSVASFWGPLPIM